MGAFESGQDFLKGVLAKLPESLRNKPLEEIVAAAEAKEALTTVGDSVLARSDYSKHMDAIREEKAKLTEDYEKLTAWYEEKKQVLDEYGRIKPEYDKLKADPLRPRTPVTDPALDPSKFIDKDTFAKEMREQQMAAANYLGLQQAITLKHYNDFKEVIDTRELLNDPNLGKTAPDGHVYGLLDAYQTKYHDKLAEKAKADEDARINKLADERVAEKMKGMQQPFPIRRSEPSVLDLIETPAKDAPKHDVDSAVALYEQLTQARAS